VVSRRTGFEVLRVVVPLVFVNVVDVQRGPEVVYFAVGKGSEAMEVEVVIALLIGVPHSDTRVMIEVELDARTDDHGESPTWSRTDGSRPTRQNGHPPG
jgi:hypothetical protein